MHQTSALLFRMQNECTEDIHACRTLKSKPPRGWSQPLAHSSSSRTTLSLDYYSHVKRKTSHTSSRSCSIFQKKFDMPTLSIFRWAWFQILMITQEQGEQLKLLNFILTTTNFFGPQDNSCTSKPTAKIHGPDNCQSAGWFGIVIGERV